MSLGSRSPRRRKLGRGEAADAGHDEGHKDGAVVVGFAMRFGICLVCEPGRVHEARLGFRINLVAAECVRRLVGGGG